MKTQETVGPLLREARQRLQLTQDAAAEAIGCNKNSVLRWEADFIREIPKAPHVDGIYKLLHLAGLELTRRDLMDIFEAQVGYITDDELRGPDSNRHSSG